MDIACARCGVKFRPRQSTSRFCSKEHRQAAYAARKAGRPEAVESVVVQFPSNGTVSGTVEAARTELAAAGRLGTHLGQAALALAARIDTSTAVNGYASLVKEFRDTMVEALKGVEQEASDVLDEIQEAALRLLRGA